MLFYGVCTHGRGLLSLVSYLARTCMMVLLCMMCSCTIFKHSAALASSSVQYMNIRGTCSVVKYRVRYNNTASAGKLQLSLWPVYHNTYCSEPMHCASES